VQSFVSRVNYSEAQSAPRDDESPAALELTVPPDFAGLRFDRALARLVPEHSRSRLKHWIDSGQVTLDGAIVEPNKRLAGGERVVVAAIDMPPVAVHAPQPIDLAIVYEDDAVLVVDKAAGLVVHPGAGNRDGTLLNALLHHNPALAALPRAGIVHRLDKDTSGLMVVAKTAIAQTDLVRQLQARTMKREYVAVVHGDIARAAIVDAPIGRHPQMRTTMAVVTRGKPARTHVAPLERFGAATFVRCALETGRTHQIRVHLTAIGHSLVGDPAYGRQRSNAAIPAFHRQALHAIRLSLDHPTTGAQRQWESPLPDDIAQLLATLRAKRTR
jgi:23S rRNA pseudouridine1911/1915/1917 synthase